MTLDTYGHVIDELEPAPPIDAEAEIRAARAGGDIAAVDAAAGG